MTKFITKPGYVTAIQYTGGNFEDILNTFQFDDMEAKIIKANILALQDAPFVIKSKQGNVIVYKWDWIVQFMNKEYMGFKDSVFNILFKEG